MFILVLICIAFFLLLAFAAFGHLAQESEPKTATARRARRLTIEITSGDLESAKEKIREAVREHLLELVRKRNAGIFIDRDGIPNGSEWNAHCQHFVDKVILPRLTHQESVEVLAAGLSSLAMELIENTVRAETQRLKRVGVALPEIRNHSGSESYRTDVPAITKLPANSRPADRSKDIRKGGNGKVTRGLIIRPEPIEKILSGTKTWEMRSRPVEIRETVALVKKGSKAAYGVADIVDCIGPLSHAERLSNMHLHGVEPHRWSDPEVAKYHYAWVLSNVRRLREPVPYVHRGGVQFVTLDHNASEQIKLSLTS